MEKGTKRRGRPKAHQQTGPLVMEGGRTHVKIEIELAETTADELREYTRWVELTSSLATTEALFKTVDFALRDVFKRDRIWQEHRRKGTEPDRTPAQKASPATASHPPPLPPPNGSAVPRGASERAL